MATEKAAAALVKAGIDRLLDPDDDFGKRRPAKVYVVTSGDYSEREIQAVFSEGNRAKAEQLVAEYERGDLGGTLHEFVLDQRAREVWRTAYWAVVDEGGHEIKTWTSEGLAEPEKRVASAPGHIPGQYVGGFGLVIRAGSYESADHALKMARDFAAKERAKEAGLT